MASIGSNLGVGSGLELDSLLAGIMNAERLPQRRLDIKMQAVTSQISALGKLNSALGAFKDSVDKLNASSFNATKVSSSSSDVATASSTKNLGASNFNLNVTKLATSTKIGMGGFANSTDVVGSGTLTFNFGKLSEDGTTFTASTDEDQIKTVDIAENASLGDIRDTINKANIGVTATIINRNGASEIIFTSDKTGEESNFSIAASNVSGDLTKLNFDPSDPDAGDGFSIQTGSNAVFTIDGREISSASNTVENAIDGLKINLLKEGTTTIRLSQDSNAASSALKSIADSYNNLLATINDVGKNVPQDPGADEVLRKDGPLAGDPVLRSIIEQVRLEVTRPMEGATGPFNSLASIGVEFNKDGTMAINNDRFKAVMEQSPEEVAKLFTKGEAGQPPSLTQRLSGVIESFSGSDGMVKGRISGLETRNKELQQQQSELTIRLTQIENNYRRQFTVLDQLVTRNQQTMTSVIAQLNTLQAQSNA